MCERQAMRAAGQVVSVSASLREMAIREELVEGNRIRVLGSGSSNGVDVEHFTSSAKRLEEASSLRRQWRIREGAPVVGFVGRLTRDKGIGDLADAFLRLERALPDLHLVLVGPEEAGDPVAAECAQKLRRHPRVRFAGPIWNVAPCYRAFDVLAFPSFREGLPNVPLEAAASERPVVGYAVTGTVDAVLNGKTGKLVDAGDRQSLSDALYAYLSDPRLRQAHGSAGRKFVCERFSRLTVWKEWLRLYTTELRRIGVPLPEHSGHNPAFAASGRQGAA
jgi:glycosyltransferase involved in cell wall biosynthesis